MEIEPLVKPVPSFSKASQDEFWVQIEQPKTVTRANEIVPVENEASSDVQPPPIDPVVDEEDRDWDLRHPMARHPSQYENLR